MHPSLLRFLGPATLLLALSTPAGIEAKPALAAAGSASGAAERWSDGYTLVILAPDADLDAAVELVREAGGGVAVVVPPRILLGWIPPESDAALLGRRGIRSIHRAPLDAPPADLQGTAARAAVHAFGRAVRGELDPAAGPPAKEGADLRLRPDARDPGPISLADVRADLEARGAAGIAATWPDEALTGNSDYMSGTVSLTLFFVESDGTGTDPDLNDWTVAAEQEVFDQAVSGLSWWSARAHDYGDCWVAFYVHAFFATEDARCSQWREPVLHSSGEYPYAIADVLANFGYTSGNHLTRATAFNVYQRSSYGTDWAYSAFVAPNPTGPNAFTDGYSAWAYYGGPYTALLQHSFGWPFGQVFAHESGHIFRACDEYYQEGYGGCLDCGPCGSTGVDNGNCESCNPNAVGCMMRASSWTLCTYTPGQIGWWRSPCGPAPLPPVVLTAVSPDGMDQDSDGTVFLQGQNFTYGMQANFGEGVEVLSVQNTSATTLEVQVHVDLEAVPGWRDVVVIRPDQQGDTLPAAFRVRATTRHYASLGGGNVYPYTSPSTAGTSLAAVIAACSEGDTVFLAAGTYLPFELRKSVTVLGGWDASFQVRAPDTTPSIVQASGAGPAVRLEGDGRSPALDGLVLRGGSGTLVAPSGLGSMFAGGGVMCLGASARIVDCVLEDNAVGTPGTPGAGGGAFFWLADATVEGCTVRGNRATRGAGIFAVESVLHLRANLVELNEGDPAAGAVRGAGVGAVSSTLDMTDDVLRANTGAFEGGGLHVEDCPRVVLDGVQVEDHAVAGSGGGIQARDAHLVLRASTVLGDTAATTGAGIDAAGDTLEIVATRVAGNRATSLGGGIHTVGCVLRLENATVTSNSGGFCSGVYSEQTAPGSEVRNSIVASNTLGGLVFMSGAAPAVDWNIVWSNGGFDYYGTAAGPHDAAVDPLFANASLFDLHLGVHSPGIDAGNPQPLDADPDGSRNDRGAYGGPWARPSAPPRVQGVQATTAGSEVHLSWSPSPASDVAWYAVYRSTDSTQVASAANFLAARNAPDTTWVDVAPVQGGWYVVAAVDSSGYEGGFSAPLRAGAPTDVAHAPRVLALHVASPSSMRSGTPIWFDLPAAASVRLDVYSVDGRRVRRLVEGRRGPGIERVVWDGRTDAGRPVAAGIFLVRLGLERDERIRKLLLTR